MALRTTPTIVICLTAGIAAGIALARPGDSASTADSRYESTSAGVAADPAPGYGDADDGPPAGTAEGGAAGITIEGFAFDGQTAVAPGTSIEVTNLDAATHTLTSDDGLFDTGRLAKDGSAPVSAPDSPGEYAFFCQIHPSMRGTLVVG